MSMGTSSNTLAEGVNFHHYFKNSYDSRITLLPRFLSSCYSVDCGMCKRLLDEAMNTYYFEVTARIELITNDVCLHLSFYWLRECGLWSQHENILTFFKFPCNASFGLLLYWFAITFSVTFTI